MSAIGPKLPETPELRAVEADRLLENGFQPPWPLKEKPLKVKGGALASHVAGLISKMAAANSTLANIEEQRVKAEADVRAAQEALETCGINSLYELSGIRGSDEYPICAEPNCERIEIHTWRAPKDVPWRCEKHQTPPPDLKQFPEAEAAEPPPAEPPKKKKGTT